LDKHSPQRRRTHRRGRWSREQAARGPPAPPRRTARADFPHTAPRQSLAVRRAQGVEGKSSLKPEETVPAQAVVESFPVAKRPTDPLALVTQQAAESLKDEVVHRPEGFPWIALAEVLSPAAEHSVEVVHGLPEWPV